MSSRLFAATHSLPPVESIPRPGALISVSGGASENAESNSQLSSTFPLLPRRSITGQPEMKISEVSMPEFNTADERSSPVSGGTSFRMSNTSITSTNFLRRAKSKLLCREQEEQILFKVYQKVKMAELLNPNVAGAGALPRGSDAKYQHPQQYYCTQVVMIHGSTGIGKTSLANSLRETVIEDDGYWVSGKFDQYFHGPEPHYAFSTAFAAFCTQVLERGEQVKSQVREQILQKLGNEARVLTDMIPNLETILAGIDKDGNNNNNNGGGHNNAGLANGGGGVGDFTQNSEAVNRFKYVFRLFVESVASPEQPLVIFLDDLHWADEPSLDLLWCLINNSSQTTSRGILFLCTLRDDADTKLIDKQLAHVSQEVELMHVHLKAFNEEEVNVVIADLLQIPKDKTLSLTNVVSRQTRGNIFFIVEFLRTLKEEGFLQYDNSAHEWKWDIEEIGLEFGDVRDLVRKRLLKVSDPVRELLKVSACLGSKLNEEALGYLVDGPVFKYLREASDLGLLEYNHMSNSFVFSHDCIKDVCYNLIPEQERKRFHYTVGRNMWKAYPIEDLLSSNIIFVIVGQLLLGCSEIKDQRERSAVAKLCLQAGMQAARQSSFMTAYNFLVQGIQLLGARRWYDDYQLCLGLHNYAAEVAYCTANFESVFHLVGEIFEHAKNFDDTLAARATQVYAFGSCGRIPEAIERGLSVLEELGIEFPEQSGWSAADKGLKKTNRILKGRSDESLLRIPVATDPAALAAMQMLNLIFVYAFLGKIELTPLIGFKMIEITLEKGLCAASCVGFVLYAMVLCGIGNDIDEGFRYGKLALKMHEKIKAKVFLGRVAAGYYGCVHGWKRPVQEILEPIKEACRVGIECGDIEFAMVNANILCWSQLDYTRLDELDREVANLTARMKCYRQETSLIMIQPFWQLLHNLMGRSHGDPRKLVGEIHDEASLDIRKFPTVYAWSNFHRMMLCYMINDFDGAYQFSIGCEELVSHPFGAVDVAIVIFFSALTNLAQAARNKKTSRKFIQKAEKDLKRISFWAKHSPLNFLGKQYLLEAELDVVKGDNFSAPAKYTSAIALSREAGMTMQTALSNERAARYFLSIDDKESAVPHLKEAVKMYRTWGGKLKFSRLEEEFRDLL